MPSLQDQLDALEAELARRDRNIAAALAVLREYGAAKTYGAAGSMEPSARTPGVQ